jgi:hypothetical protein
VACQCWSPTQNQSSKLFIRAHPFHGCMELRGCVLLRQEEYYGKEVIVADREMVESQVDAILRDADKEDVAFLVVGDPFG